MEEITTKEWLISVAIVVLAISMLVFINPFVKDSMLDDIRLYMNALQITDAQQFKYAKTTQVGNVLAYGKMSALHPASIPELLGKYSIIEKVTERYTQHTRQVCNGYDKDGKCTGYRTEIYYTWDTWNRQSWASDSFDYLSETFSVYELEISTCCRAELSSFTVAHGFVEHIYSNYIYEGTAFWDSEGDLRFYYNVLPEYFNASMFVRFDGGKIRATTYYEMSPSQVLENKESNIKKFDIVYYLLGVLLVGGGYFYWAYSLGDVR